MKTSLGSVIPMTEVCDDCGAEFESYKQLTGHMGSCNGEEWRDPSVLEELYWDQELSTTEIADKYDIAPNTVSYQLNKSGLGTRSISESKLGDISLKDPDVARKMYVDKGMSTTEMAEHFGCSGNAIQYWLEKHGIQRRDRNKLNSNSIPQIRSDKEGREYIRCDGKQVKHYRLLAIADGADPYKIYSEGHHVHHRNWIPWDNRTVNLEVLSPSEHSQTTQDAVHNSVNYEIV